MKNGSGNSHRNIVANLLSLLIYTHMEKLDEDDDNKSLEDWNFLLSHYSNILKEYMGRLNFYTTTNHDDKENIKFLLYKVFDSAFDLMNILTYMLANTFDDSWYETKLLATTYSDLFHEDELQKFIKKFGNNVRAFKEFTNYFKNETQGEEVTFKGWEERARKVSKRDFMFLERLRRIAIYNTAIKEGKSHEEAIEIVQLTTFDKTIEEIENDIKEYKESLNLTLKDNRQVLLMPTKGIRDMLKKKDKKDEPDQLRVSIDMGSKDGDRTNITVSSPKRKYYGKLTEIELYSRLHTSDYYKTRANELIMVKIFLSFIFHKGYTVSKSFNNTIAEGVNRFSFDKFKIEQIIKKFDEQILTDDWS